MSTSAEPLDGTQTPVQGSTENVSFLSPPQTKTLAEKQEEARWSIARPLIFAYIGLLAFSLVIPLLLLWVPRVSGNSFTVSDARDLMLAMSGALSGLVGILGFVMGYYFKTLDERHEPAAPGKKRVRSSA